MNNAKARSISKEVLHHFNTHDHHPAVVNDPLTVILLTLLPHTYDPPSTLTTRLRRIATVCNQIAFDIEIGAMND